MSKSVKRKPEEKKIHRVGKDHPERLIDQELRRINSIEDLENIDLDEVLENYTTNTTHTN
jgi:hypothetical protein